MITTVKFNQKVGLKDFKVVEEQCRNGGVPVFQTVGGVSDNGVQTIRRIGVANLILNLGKKLEAKIKLDSQDHVIEDLKLVKVDGNQWRLQCHTKE